MQFIKRNESVMGCKKKRKLKHHALNCVRNYHNEFDLQASNNLMLCDKNCYGFFDRSNL